MTVRATPGSFSRWTLFSLPVLAVGLASPFASSCSKPPAAAAPASSAKAGPASCEQMKTGDFSGVQIITASDVQARMRRVMGAGHTLAKTGKEFETELIAACAELGTAIGVADLDVKAQPNGGKGAVKVCTNVGEKVAKMIKDARADKVELTIEYDPPKCYSDVDAAKKCLAECGSPVTADLQSSCKGGEISGRCQGKCGGSCILEAGPGTSACRAVCTGKCDRDFRGACGGKCDGTCNGLPTRGAKACVGVCDGSCNGQAEGVCSGKCDGACSGDWEPRDPSKCPGRCAGACAGALEAPVCSGDFAPQGVDTACVGICGSPAAMSARCEAPLVRITAKGGRQNADLQKLLAALQAYLPRIVRLREGTAAALTRGIDGMIAGGVDMTNTYALAGSSALFCVRTASDGAKASADTIAVAVKGSEGVTRALKSGL